MNELLIALIGLNIILSVYLILNLTGSEQPGIKRTDMDLLSKELKENRTELTSF